MSDGRSHKSLIWLIVAFVALALVGGGGVLLLRSSHSPEITRTPAVTPPAQHPTPSSQETPKKTPLAERIRIVTRSAGLYRLTEDAARAAGLDLATVSNAGLHLSNRGQAVPFILLGNGNQRSLVFYATPSDNIYSPYNVYWLQQGGQSPTPMQQVSSALGNPSNTARSRVRFQQQRQYLSTLPEGKDHWLWQPIYGRRGVTVTFTLTDVMPGESDIRISLWSTSSAPANPDHHVIVEVNGHRVCDATWDGQGRQVLTGTIPSGTMRSGENQLAILAPGDTEAPVEASYLDWFDVTYPRQLRAHGGWLDFLAGPGAYEITGLPRGEVTLWDITDLAHPAPLSGFDVSQESGGQTIRFSRADVTGERHYLVAAGDGLLSPSAVEAHTAVEAPRPDGADYIAIVHSSLMKAIQPLLKRRSAQGLRVFTVTPEALYDAYSFGLQDPAAIRAFLADALRSWPEPRPRYVLLVGDASYDAYDYVKGPERNLIPTALVQTRYVGQTASDNWLADVDGDGRPDIALGRFPAQTPEDVQAMVRKTMWFEDHAGETWAHRALVVADNRDTAFIRMSDMLVNEYLAPIFEVERVYLGWAKDPHAQILQAINRGVGVVNYVGHGSITVWAKEKVLSTADISALHNKQPPLLVTMTCLTGYFHHPKVVSLAETLLRAHDRGVVAALAPTSESLSLDQQALAKTFYHYLTDPAVQTVGEAMMLAKREVPLDQEGARDVVATFNLLGDPALRISFARPAK
ncbi:MAG: hypothetical protein J7M34_05510 [Anaerolineae bacterium]|nr:hypothetical protein [Anaerolineae bacterium]